MCFSKKKTKNEKIIKNYLKEKYFHEENISSYLNEIDEKL